MHECVDKHSRSVHQRCAPHVGVFHVHTDFLRARNAGPRAKGKSQGYIYIDMHGYEECLYHQQ